MVVLQDVRLLQARRTLRDRVPVGVLDVRDLDREVHDPVAVLGDVPPIAVPAFTGPQNTNRAPPDSSTCNASSGLPFSGPRYAILRIPNAVE